MGLPTLPDKLDEGSCVWIAQTLHERGLTMAAISGTFNMGDPNASRLQRQPAPARSACRGLPVARYTDHHALHRLARRSRHVEVASGQRRGRARGNGWSRRCEQAVAIADRHEVTLAFEPEINNVVSSVMHARRLLDEIDSPWLKVVIDPANLLPAVDLDGLSKMLNEARFFDASTAAGVPSLEGKGPFLAMLDEAFDWLGPEIVLAHAKNPPGIEETVDVAEFERLIGESRGLSGPGLEALTDELATEKGRHEFQRVLLLVVILSTVSGSTDERGLSAAR